MLLETLGLCTIGICGFLYKKESLYHNPTHIDPSLYQSYDYYIKRDIHGLYYPIKSVVNNDTIVIVLHGNAGNVYNRRYIAEGINEAGFNCYLAEYPGYGKMSKQKLSLKNIIKSLKYVVEYFSMKYKNIVLCCNSIGGVIGTRLLSSVKFPENITFSMIILSSPSNIGDIIDRHIYIPIGNYIETDYNTLSNIDNFKTIPKKMLVGHCKNDRIVPYKCSQKILKRIKTSIKDTKVSYIDLVEGDYGDGHNNITYNWPLILSYVV